MRITAQEKNFENRVKDFLKNQGAWFLKYWGGAKFTRSGIPDLLVCLNGCFLGIELKAPRGHPEELQLYHLKEIDKSGGFAILLYPKDYERFKELVETVQDYDCSARESENYKYFRSVWIAELEKIHERKGE